jgi:predicted RNA-binding protein YlxR (DUF448 family)
MRTCAGCKKGAEKEQLIRFVEFEGTPHPDPAEKLPGRGFYTCPNFNCLKQALKKRYRGKVNPQEVYERTLKSLTDYLYHLVSLCHKTGVTVIGQDNIKKLREEEGTLILSKELSPKTKERLKRENWLVLDGLFSSQELGNALRRESSVGALFIEKVGLGRKLFQVASKLKELLESKRN